MNLENLMENLSEKSPKERMRAIQVFEEASRKRMNDALSAAKKSLRSIKAMRQRWMDALGTSDIRTKMEDFAKPELNLNPQDQKNWEQLKKVVDKIYAEKLEELKISKKESQKSRSILSRSKFLKV